MSPFTPPQRIPRVVPAACWGGPHPKLGELLGAQPRAKLQDQHSEFQGLTTCQHVVQEPALRARVPLALVGLVLCPIGGGWV